jgi:esterase FrsA
VIVDALCAVTGSTDALALRRALHELSMPQLYSQITVPLLVINGDNDTLCGTRDSIELATHAPHAMLKLYPADDHCAMNHFDQWLELTQNWLLEQVSTRA